MPASRVSCPNILCVCVDTFRADIIGPGKRLSFVRTPNLDALMRESVVFDRAYGEAQATIQMRNAFFTGQRTFPYRHTPGGRGVDNPCLGWHRIPDEYLTLADLLFDAGYVTGLVSDVFHMFKPNMNFTRGFLHWDFVRGQEADPLHCGPLDAVDLRRHVPDGEADDLRHAGLRRYLLNVRDRRTELDYFTPRLVNGAVRFLEDNYRHAPFFLWMDSFAPHEYWDPPRYFADRYYADPAAKDFILPQLGQSRTEQTGKTAADIERTKALYYGYVTFVDKWLGVLFDKLTDMGLWDDTIVCFVSDHGTELLDNGVFSKNLHGPRNYNQQLNWLIRHPDRSFDGRHVEPFVLSHDLPATILDLAGVAPPEPMQGRSVWPLVTRAATDVHGDTIIGGWVERACVRDREWCYIVDTIRPDAQALLFHSANDPYETRDVAADFPAIVRDRRHRLEEFLGQSLPATYAHQPDYRNIPTLRRLLEIRERRGMTR